MPPEVSELTVGLLQLRSPATQAEAADHLEPRLREAAARGARLIVTPEFTNFMERDDAKLRDRARTEDEDLVVLRARALAAELGVWVLLGSVAVKGEDGRLANRSLLLNDTGEIVAAYDKMHLFDLDLPDGRRVRESDTFAPGARPVVADTPWGPLGLSVCYDVRFPYIYRSLAQAGAAMIAVPAAFTRPTGRAHWELLVRTRAVETGAYVLAPAQGGEHEDGRRTWGRSMIVAPSGEIVVADDGDEPGVLVATLDLGAVRQARGSMPAWAPTPHEPWTGTATTGEGR